MEEGVITQPPRGREPERPMLGNGTGLPLVSFVLCLLLYLTVLHELGHVAALDLPGGMPYGTFYACLSRSVGIFCGGLICLTPPLKRVIANHLQPFCIGTLWILLLFTVFFCAEALMRQPLPIVCGMLVFMSACATSLVVPCLIGLNRFSSPVVAAGLALGIGLCALEELALFLAPSQVPEPLLFAFPLLLCLVSLFLTYRWKPMMQCSCESTSLSPTSSSSECSPNGEKPLSRPLQIPWEPVVHLLSYGFVFGFLHTALGAFQLLGTQRYVYSFAGSLLACALVIATYGRGVTKTGSVWTNLRRLAFPLASGFVIIPALLHDFSAYTFLNASSCYYGCLFVLGCLSMMRDSVMPPLPIASAGITLIGLGLVVGSICGFLPLPLDHLNDQGFLSACVMLSFAVATIGTFWIGDDHALRTWWGLRRNYTAKHYREQIMLSKCKQLSSAHGLSDRECEVLLLLAQGRRATQIKDDLFISINTVRVHIRNIYNKLDVHSVKQLTDLLDEVVP